MFSIFKSEKKKTRRHAENWLHLAQKAYHYRRDLLREKELRELTGAIKQVRDSLKKKEDVSRLRLASERLEDAVRRYGGVYYKRSGWAENVEVILVAAILAIGIRTFFVQPFKIPTNSMWPTYYGMTHEVFQPHGEEPRTLGGTMRKLALGASRRAVEAPVSGRVLIPVRVSGDRVSPRIPGQVVPARRFLILPGQAHEYTLFVDGTPVRFQAPPDFQVEPVIRDAFFPEANNFNDAVAARLQEGRVRQTSGDMALVETDLEVNAGDPVLSFDILTGDQLFVDRISYHFVRPNIGDAVVFRTEGIPGIPAEKYYIKRMVGLPGDTLEIQEPVLLRNDEPIDTSVVFDRIHEEEEPYRGYINHGNLNVGQTVAVPDNMYYTLGDNSGNSRDSRDWGFVPEDQLVGRSLFIYYPFTGRWGPAK